MNLYDMNRKSTFSAGVDKKRTACSFGARILLFLTICIAVALPSRAQQECEPLPVPSLTDFDTVTPAAWNERGMLPECWDFVFMGNDSTYTPHVTADTTAIGNSVVLIAGDEPQYGSVNCLLLPHFASPYDALAITFQVRMDNDTTGDLALGYWHVDGPASYFVALEVLPRTTYDSLYTFNLRGRNIPEGDRLAFSWGNNDTCAQCRISLVSSDSLQLCLTPVVTSATVLSDSHIRVTWERGWNEQAWEIEYGPTGFSHGDGTLLPTQQPLADLTGLTAQTTYDLYVRGLCPNGDTTDWTPVVRRMTPCVDAEIPYHEDFESYTGTPYGTPGPMAICWNVISSASQTYYPHVSTWMTSGNNDVIMTSSTSASQGKDNFVVLPWFSSDLNGTKISFSSKMQNAGFGELSLGYIADLTDTSTYVILETITNSTSVSSHEVSLYQRGIPQGARLAFRWRQDRNSFSFNCAIDNIDIQFLPCPAVTNVQVSDVMMTTSRVSWTPGDVEDTWLVEYGPAGFNHDSTGTTLIVNDTFADLTGLIGEQPIDVYVQSICDPKNPSPFSDVVTFTPYCSVVGDTTAAVACDSMVWLGKTYTTSGLYTDTLYQAGAYFCDSIVSLNLTVHYSHAEYDTLVYCQNELPVTWRDTTFEADAVSNEIIFHRTTLEGCDSTIYLSLTIHPSFYLEEYDTICHQALPYTWRDTIFDLGTEDGVFTFTRLSEHGCDSVVTLHLTVYESFYQTEVARICEQELPYHWRDTTFLAGTVSGLYTFNRESVHGCDSIVTLALVVDPTYNEEHEVVLCRSELPYTWRGHTFATDAVSETFVYNGQTVKGCDSTVTLHLTINEANESYDTVEICDSELPYIWHDQIFRTDALTGDYSYVRTNAVGCDSIAHLRLVIHPTYDQEFFATICDSDLPYLFGDTLFAEGSQTQVVTRHLQTARGCDSVVNLHLTVNPVKSRYETLDICRSELPYTYYDTIFHVGTPSDLYVIHRQTSMGCDSVIYLTLNIRQSFGGSETVVVCEDELPIVWHNELIARGTPSGSYTFARHTQYGCDSIMVLNLVVNPVYRQMEDVTICDSELPYTWRDTTFEVGTRGGSYLFVKPSRGGCDSTVVLNLTVNPAYEATEDIAICESELPFTFIDTTFLPGSTSGDYTLHYTTRNHCDSIVNLHLTIYPTAETDDYITLCQNDFPFTYHEVVFPVGSQSQDHDFRLATEHGCDSLVHLHLTVNPIYNLETSAEICDSELPYHHNDLDTTFGIGTRTGDYRFRRITADGCDSVITLHLTVHPTYQENVAEVICQNDLPYEWRDTLFAIGTESGVFTFSRNSVAGCDSVVTLALIVQPSYEQYETVDVCADGFPFTWRDTTFLAGTTSGEFTFHRQTVRGCDSIVTLQLNVYPTYSQNESFAICESDLPYTWRDVTFPEGTISGIYTYERQSQHGCDSVVTLVLTVRPTFTQTFYAQICENALPYYYAQTDTTFGVGTTSGTYRFHYQNAFGCDSVVILNLAVHPYYEGEESLTICSSELPYYYERENRTFPVGTTSGDYPFAHHTSFGCDSLWTLHLTVNPSYNQSELVQICETELPYAWRDTLFEEGTMSGSFTFHNQTHLGCDSTVILTLFVYPVPSVTIVGPSEMILGDREMLVAQASHCNFEWSTGEQNSLIYIEPDTAGVYTYSVTATHSTTHCSSSASHSITVIDTTIGIHTYTNLPDVDVFPNPAIDRITIATDHEQIRMIELYNLAGALVRRIEGNDERVEMELGDTAPGTYVLRVVLREGGIVHKKLIIK